MLGDIPPTPLSRVLAQDVKGLVGGGGEARPPIVHLFERFAISQQQADEACQVIALPLSIHVAFRGAKASAEE